jgi:hypothetical protein
MYTAPLNNALGRNNWKKNSGSKDLQVLPGLIVIRGQLINLMVLKARG